MRILIACEYSGRVREAFSALGHDAWSCDLIDTEQPGQHIIGDALEVAYNGTWDMMIAHPPCTYLTNTANRWLYNKDGSKNIPRWDNMRDAAKFFKALYDAPIPKKVLENPIQNKYGLEMHGCGKATQYVQPWMFGHMEQKATGLWLQGVPKLKPTNDVKSEMMKLSLKERQRLFMLPPSEDRWKIRSRTFEGIALAMADQWSR